MRRIAVIGDSGSGKNHLAERLSSLLNVSVYDFDDIEWERKFDVARPAEKLDSMVGGVLKNKEWIVTAIPHQWTLPAIQRAQRIVVLRRSVFVEAFRILQRFVKRKFCSNPPKESLRRLAGSIKHKFFERSSTDRFIERFGEMHAGKIVKPDSDFEVSRFLEDIKTGGPYRNK
jgi:adenylate kinase family enzyme